MQREDTTEQGFALTILEGIDVFFRTPNVCRGFCSHDVKDRALSRSNGFYRETFSPGIDRQGFDLTILEGIDRVLPRSNDFIKRSKEQGYPLTTETRR